MSALPNRSGNRLDFRVSTEHKRLIERAAVAEGQTVSSFAIASLLQAAEAALQRASVRTLSARDSRAFLKMLDSDAEPNAALRAAAKHYKARRGR